MILFIYQRIKVDNYFEVMDNTQKKNKMNIVDIDKLKAQYDAGLSIRKLSILWNLPYVSLYRALKRVGQKKDKKS